MIHRQAIGVTAYTFDGLVELLAKASPRRSGDELAGCAAATDQERVAAQWALAEVPLQRFLDEDIVPAEDDDVTRLIHDTFDAAAFAPVAQLTVGGLRDWLLGGLACPGFDAVVHAVQPGLTPEMVAAVSKLMGTQDLVAVSSGIQNRSAFRTTIGARGRLATRLQPNHPTDDPAGVALSVLDGLLMGAGDAVVGINPATDAPQQCADLLRLLDDLRTAYDIPVQSCVLTHVTTTLGLMEAGVPVDLVFQSIAGTQDANSAFGVTLPMLAEAAAAGRELDRGTVGDNVMYFETGQGTPLSSGTHLGAGNRPVDQQTLECRAHGVARAFDPLLVNTVVGFIGPEYLYDGKQIIRAGLEDNFCGKLLGLPMGVDVCYTNHAEADQDDMDNLLGLLAQARTSFVIAVPGGDDVMLGYQTLSFHDVLAARRMTGLRPAPEFEQWLQRIGLADAGGGIRALDPAASPLRSMLEVAR